MRSLRACPFCIQEVVVQKDEQSAQIEHTEVDRIIRHQLLRDEEKRDGHPEGSIELLRRGGRPMQPGLVAEHEDKENIYETLATWK